MTKISVQPLFGYQQISCLQLNDFFLRHEVKKFDFFPL